MTTTTTPRSQADLESALRTRLIQSGEYSRIMEKLRTGLMEDHDWNDRVRDLAREQARTQSSTTNGTEPPHLSSLIQSMEPKALEMIPDQVRQEITAIVHEFVQKTVE